MAGEWVEEEARRLCGCGGLRSMTCRCHSLEKGIRAGLRHAAEVARLNDACVMCSAVLLPEVLACDGPCINSYDETEHGEPVSTADLIERLLTPTEETTNG